MGLISIPSGFDINNQWFLHHDRCFTRASLWSWALRAGWAQNPTPRWLNPAPHGENSAHTPVPNPALDVCKPNCLRQFKKSITMVISLFRGRAGSWAIWFPHAGHSFWKVRTRDKAAPSEGKAKQSLITCYQVPLLQKAGLYQRFSGHHHSAGMEHCWIRNSAPLLLQNWAWTWFIQGLNNKSCKTWRNRGKLSKIHPLTASRCLLTLQHLQEWKWKHVQTSQRSPTALPEHQGLLQGKYLLR